MNASLWQLAGWTMIHSLWLGGAVALAGGFLRLACRRAMPNTRYAISLATLALLAVTPLATAAWLSVNGVPVIDSVLLPLPGGEGWGGGQPGYTASHPSLTLPLKGGEPEKQQGSPAGLVIDLAHTNPSPRYSGERLGEGQNPPSATPQTSATVENPSPNPSVQGRGISDHRSPITDYLFSLISLLPTLWLIGAPLTFTLLATGLLGSARLRRRATPLTAGSAFDACERLRHTLNITRRVALAACDGVAQPILVGLFRPLILLPTAALAGWTPEQLDMVLLHELAHVRRWDNLVNLLQRIVESLLFFHLAVWLVSRQVRRDREECCDAAVIAHTDRPHQYAELLVSIASALRGGPAPSLAVASAMASHPLAGRIRRILNLEEEPMRITRRMLAATLLLPLLLAGAIFYSGASAQDLPPSKTGSPGSPNQGGAATGSISDKTQSTAKASLGSAAPIQEPEPPSKDPVYLMIYELDSFPSNVDLRQWMEIIASDPRIEIQWQPKEKRLILSASKSRHQQLGDLFNVARKTATPDGDLRTEVEIPQLQNEIRNLESLIVETQKELVDIEVFKELSAQASQTTTVRDELDADRNLNDLNAQLLSIDKTIESEEYDGAKLAELEALRNKIENERDEYRKEAMKAIRDRLEKEPNETLRAAIVEYKMRRAAADVNLAEYQQRLLYYKQKLAAATAQLDVPPAIGTYATPTIAAVEAMKKSPTHEPTYPQYKQLRELFTPTASNPAVAVKYKVPPGVRKYLEGLFSNVEKDPYGPQISFPRVWADDELSVEITAPQEAQVQYLSIVFGALLAETYQRQQAGDTSSATPASGSDQSDLRTVLAESKARLERQLAELKQRTAKGDGAAAELPVASALEQKILEWEVMNRARGSLPKEQLPNSVKPSSAGGPGSLNQGGEATGSSDKAAEPLFTKQGLSLSSDDRSLSLAQDRANERIKAERSMRKSEPRRSVETVQAELATDRALLRLESDLKHLEQKTRSRFPEIEAPGRRAAIEETAVRLKAIREQLKIEREAGSPGSPNQGGTATGSPANNAQPTPNASPGSAAPVQEPEPPFPFPTLENQKIADRAYKLLGLELEPLSAEDLERVKKLGYAGGLKVAQVTGETRGAHGSLRVGNLLVGLHVWPVTDLTSLDEILRRPDLGELAPLKYYAVREVEGGTNSSVTGDELTTGRLSIPEAELLSRDLAAADRMQAEMAAIQVPSDSVTMMQPPTTQKTSIFGGTVTTAYLKVKFDRLPYSFDDASARLTPQELERNSMNCIAIIKSPNVLKAALAVITPREAADMKPEEAVVWLMNRLSATFPGDGEILELKLEGDDAKEDSVLLQAVIDAFIAAMNMPPESPADPNAVPGSATEAPGDLSRYASPAATPVLKAESADAANTPARDHTPVAALEAGDAVALNVAGAFPEAPLDDVFVIEPEGTLALGPLYGRVAVAGKTVLEAEAVVQEHLSKTLTDVAVQLTLAMGKTPAAATSEDGASSSPTFLYDGKTFDQWRDLWKLELNPERRTEAINALSAFGRAGYGQQAAEVILDVAGEYRETYAAESPEGQLRAAIKEAVVRMPADLWMPQIQAKMKASEGADKEFWQREASRFLASTNDRRPEARTLAAGFADAAENDLGLLSSLSFYFLRNDQELSDPLTVEFVRKALRHEGVAWRNNLNFLNGRHLDKIPEQIDLILRQPEAREMFIDMVSDRPNHASDLVGPLLAAAQDPKRGDERIAALRMLKRLDPQLKISGNEAARQQIADQAIEILRNGPDELLPAAMAIVAKYQSLPLETLPAELLQQETISPERAKQLKQLKIDALHKEFNAP